jgi:hypothetical protein
MSIIDSIKNISAANLLFFSKNNQRQKTDYYSVIRSLEIRYKHEIMFTVERIYTL